MQSQGRQALLEPAARNESLHGLRGAATLAVFAYHLYGNAVTYGISGGFAPASLPAELLEMLRLSVPLFFLISGYVIFGALCRERSMARFLLKRGQRIYPTFLVPHLLWFALGPALGVGWLAQVDTLGWIAHFVSNLLFLPGVFELPIAQGVAWTLSYEVTFYLVAALGVWLARRDRGPAISLAWLTWGALVMTILWLRPTFCYFAAGVVCFALRGRIGTIAAGHRLAATIAAFAGVWIMHAMSASPVIAAVASTLMLAPLIAQTGLLCQLCLNPTLRYLGTISYSLYLWHPMVLSFYRRAFVHADLLTSYPMLRVACFVAACLATTLLLAHFSYLFLECWLTDYLFHRGRVVGVTGIQEPASPLRRAA